MVGNCKAMCLSVSEKDIPLVYPERFILSIIEGSQRAANLFQTLYVARAVLFILHHPHHRNLNAIVLKHRFSGIDLRGGTIHNDKPRHWPLVVPQTAREYFTQCPRIVATFCRIYLELSIFSTLCFAAIDNSHHTYDSTSTQVCDIVGLDAPLVHRTERGRGASVLLFNERDILYMPDCKHLPAQDYGLFKPLFFSRYLHVAPEAAQKFFLLALEKQYNAPNNFFILCFANRSRAHTGAQTDLRIKTTLTRAGYTGVAVRKNFADQLECLFQL